jgi:hypothetical protein
VPLDPRAEQRSGLFPASGAVERFSFEAVLPDGSGLLVRFAFRPGACTYWALRCAPGGEVVVVREPGAGAPAGRTLEVRADGLWAAAVCEVPFDHWSLGLEAFAVRLDDPAEGWRGERGERVPFGVELDWEAGGPPAGEPGDYVQGGRLHGDVIVGRLRHRVDGRSMRSHATGPVTAPPPAEVRATDGSRVIRARTSSVGVDAAGLPVGATTTEGAFETASCAALESDGRRVALAAGWLDGVDGTRMAGWLEHSTDAPTWGDGHG